MKKLILILVMLQIVQSISSCAARQTDDNNGEIPGAESRETDTAASGETTAEFGFAQTEPSPAEAEEPGKIALNEPSPAETEESGKIAQTEKTYSLCSAIMPDNTHCEFNGAVLSTTENCDEKEIPDSEVSVVLAKAQFAGTTAAIISTSSSELYAALRTDGGYTAFCLLGDYSLLRNNSVSLRVCENMLGREMLLVECSFIKDGSYNYCFTLEEKGMALLTEGREITIYSLGELLAEMIWSGDYTELNLYRDIDGRIYKCGIKAELERLFPGIEMSDLRFRPNCRYESHKGLIFFTLSSNEPQEDREGWFKGGKKWYEDCVGWYEDGVFYFSDESELTLPEYKYTPTDFRTDDKALSWLVDRFNGGSDFALREEIDPTELDDAELKAYMDEAYQAGMNILSVYDMDTNGLFCMDYRSSNMECYFANGMFYEDTQNPAFPTLSAWETYMRRILSDELVESLISTKTFVDIDGKLYGIGAARGGNIHMFKRGSEIRSVTDKDITYVDRVAVRSDLDDTVEVVEFEFHYSKTEDGWRWTSLYLYD